MTHDLPAVPEILLTLRAPGAGWLATLIAALDEAQRDPDFNPRYRELFAQLAAGAGVPSAIADAARRRALTFENTLEQEHRDAAPLQADVA